MKNVIATIEKNGLTAHIIVDDYGCPEGPREWCNTGTLCLADSTACEGELSPSEAIAALESDPNIIGHRVYRYKHSGVAYNTTGFSCPWDSGCVGAIYVTKEKIRQEYGVKRISKKLRAKVLDLLNKEVEIFSSWADGDVFGVVVTATDDEDKEFDSCFGFIGMDHARPEAEQMLGWIVERETKKAKASVQEGANALTA